MLQDFTSIKTAVATLAVIVPIAVIVQHLHTEVCYLQRRNVASGDDVPVLPGFLL